MIKQFIHKVLSVLMAFLVLFSTVSFTIDKHYCGSTLVDVAIFHKAKGCGMEMQNPSNKDCSITKKNCCKEELIVIKGQDELKLSLDKISFEQQVFIASFVYTYSNLFEEIKENVSSYIDYKPPLVIRQIFKIDETYLI